MFEVHKMEGCKMCMEYLLDNQNDNDGSNGVKKRDKSLRRTGAELE